MEHTGGRALLNTKEAIDTADALLITKRAEIEGLIDAVYLQKTALTTVYGKLHHARAFFDLHDTRLTDALQKLDEVQRSLAQLRLAATAKFGQSEQQQLQGLEEFKQRVAQLHVDARADIQRHAASIQQSRDRLLQQQRRLDNAYAESKDINIESQAGVKWGLFSASAKVSIKQDLSKQRDDLKQMLKELGEQETRLSTTTTQYDADVHRRTGRAASGLLFTTNLNQALMLPLWCDVMWCGVVSRGVVSRGVVWLLCRAGEDEKAAEASSGFVASQLKELGDRAQAFIRVQQDEQMARMQLLLDAADEARAERTSFRAQVDTVCAYLQGAAA